MDKIENLEEAYTTKNFYRWICPKCFNDFKESFSIKEHSYKYFILNNQDITYRYEIDGELNHEIREAYIDEYGYYPDNFWIDDPQYSYPDGVINVTGIEDINDDAVDGEVNVE